MKEINPQTDQSVETSTEIPTSSTLPASFYTPVETDLTRVEDLLHKTMSSSQPLLETLFEHGRNLSGKRLRPVVTLLSGMVCGEISEKHITSAAVMELIHTASLVHDDILDEADLRRHQETVNARWNNELAVLFGDLLLAKSVNLAASLEDIPAFNLIAQTSSKLCEGELLQIANLGNFDITEETYNTIIEGKTASLIECSCRLGAFFSGANQEVVDHLGMFGHHLGMAFQIIDDLLDLSGQQATVGKTLGQDIKKQKATLAVIFTLQCVSAEKRTEIAGQMKAQPKPLEVLQPWITRTNALDFTRKAAEKRVDLALEQLK